MACFVAQKAYYPIKGGEQTIITKIKIIGGFAADQIAGILFEKLKPECCRMARSGLNKLYLPGYWDEDQIKKILGECVPVKIEFIDLDDANLPRNFFDGYLVENEVGR